MTLDPDALANREMWTRYNSEYNDANAAQNWAAAEISWGIFGVPETDVNVIGDVAGLDVVELGCGTAYFSSWLARRGARPVGVDVTPAQLNTARRMQAQTGIEFALIEASAEAVPLPDASFDLALSEYGASLWCDPEKWIPEAARLLRPGGRLIFLTNSVLVTLCVPETDDFATTSLQRPQRGLGRIQWSPDDGVEHHRSHGAWIDLLHLHGFSIQALREIYSPDGAVDHPWHNVARADWARQWPLEDLWVARLRD
ncbi:MAG: class I SAM-dependent methyltransferase [Actinomycetes bacterium]